MQVGLVTMHTSQLLVLGLTSVTVISGQKYDIGHCPPITPTKSVDWGKVRF